MTEAQETKREARAAAATERAAERAHEAELTRMYLDRITTLSVKRGDIVVLTVPQEFFVYPGTKAEDVTEEQSAMMETGHKVLGTLVEGLHRQGILPASAAILGEGMTLSDLPPPWEKHPDSRDPSEHVVVPGKKLYLPSGTKI